MNRRTVRLATRGSDLALRQARGVQRRLEGRRFDVELVEVETRGDRIRDELIHRLGKTGAFVRSLDEEVLAGEADAAVHSMKDVPTESPDELVVAGIPERGPPGDVLVTPDGAGLSELPEGAVVGTSSLRREAQVRRRRPDATVEPLRGNVDTRVEKLLAPHRQREHERRLDAEESAADDDGDDLPEYDRSVDEWFDDLSEVERRAMGRQVDVEYDAIVLAEAGLQRLDLLEAVPHERLDPRESVPAPGQGAIAVTARDGDLASAIHDAVDHPRTRVETTVERTVLATLGGGCVAPLGAYAVLQGETVRTTAAVYDRAGEDSLVATRRLPVDDYVAAARGFADDLADRGAAEMVAAARVDDGEDREAKRG
jgi:hydroxymethylbilane synthase